MEGKLKEIMDSCDLNMFETLNLAIRVASHIHPTDLALRRDHIIDSLYRSPIVNGEDGSRVFDKKAKVAKKACTQSGPLPAARQELPNRRRESTDAKGKSKMQLPEEPGACAREDALKIREVPSLPSERLVPVGTNQGYPSANKGKEQFPFTNFKDTRAIGLNMRNNEASLSVMKGKNTVLPREEVKKHVGPGSKSLSIRDGNLPKKLKSGHSESFQLPHSKHAPDLRITSSRDKQSSVLAISHDFIEMQDDGSDGENEEDPLDWWTEKELQRTDNQANASDDG